MVDRPLIFSAPMIRALLAGRKTQTRRVLKLPKVETVRGDWQPGVIGGAGQVDGLGRSVPARACVWHTQVGTCVSPAQAIGDRLWVRENVRAEELPDGHDGVRYPADSVWLPIENTAAAADRWSELFYYGGERGKERLGRQVPSIHMPRWASRLTLVVTDVRVERLNEISEADAKAEGIRLITCLERGRDGFTATGDCFGHTRREAFAHLWQSIHGPEAWAANPWVCALTFTVHHQNVDTMRAPAGAELVEA